MVKDVKITRWLWLLQILNSAVVSLCYMNIYIKMHKPGKEVPAPPVIQAALGDNITLRCVMAASELVTDEKLIWGRRTKLIRFRNEWDLMGLADKGWRHLDDLQAMNEPYRLSRANKQFRSLKPSDYGTHFCMTLKYKLFKIIRIVPKELNYDSYPGHISSNMWPCLKDRFRCEATGHCINLHYMCDGKVDCLDASDEDWFICDGDPCKGKIYCHDGRCIPTSWCCNYYIDDNCTVPASARPSCCPPLLNPYDPAHYYNSTQRSEGQVQKSSGPRYLFISVCVITAVLSFILFLFIISKMCGLDKKPPSSRRGSRLRGHAASIRCDHSECAIRRELGRNGGCLYQLGTARMLNLNSDNNNDMSDPLISVSSITVRSTAPAEVSDQPPSYAEVVTTPVSADKSLLDDLINAPPPPYSSTKFSSEANCNNLSNNQVCDSTRRNNASE